MAASTIHSSAPALDGSARAVASAAAWTVELIEGGPYTSRPCRTMPPPTQIMAAVPTALRIFRNTGIPRTRARPSARPIPARTKTRSLLAKGHTEIVGFHDQRYGAIHDDGDPESLAQSPSARLSFAVVPTKSPAAVGPRAKYFVRNLRAG